MEETLPKPKILLNIKEKEEERTNAIKKELEELGKQLLQTKDVPLKDRPKFSYHAPIDFIKTYPGLERTYSKEKLESLKKSILQNGIMSKPLCTLEIDNPNAFVLSVLGNRRINATKDLGQQFVDVVLQYLTVEEAFQMSFDENDEREDLNPLDRALQFKSWIDRTGITQAKIAELRNKSETWVWQTLKLLTLPKEIQEHIKNEKISMNQANKILRLKDEYSQQIIANLCIQHAPEADIDAKVQERLSEMEETLKEVESDQPNTETKPNPIVIPNTEGGILNPNPRDPSPKPSSDKGYDHMTKDDLQAEIERQNRENEQKKGPYHARKILESKQDDHCGTMENCSECWNKTPDKYNVCKAKNKLSKETFAKGVTGQPFLDDIK